MGIYNTFLYQPIFNAFVWLYNVIPGQSMGLVIIVITLIIRVILYPLYKKQVQAQKAMQDLQPKLKAVKEEYKNDQEGQAKALMQLYKDNKVNPFSSCLPLLIQFPLFIAVYQVLRDGLTKPESLDLLYASVARPETINTLFLGIDLAASNVVLAVLAGAAQFWQIKMLTQTRPSKEQREKEGAKDEDMAAMMNKQMKYIMPVMIVVIGLSLPSGLALYWLITTAFMIVQQYIAFNKKQPEVEVIKAS